MEYVASYVLVVARSHYPVLDPGGIATGLTDGVTEEQGVELRVSSEAAVAEIMVGVDRYGEPV